MAFTPTDISNRALQMLGCNPINSMTDGTKNARECTLCYDTLRQALLESHPWSFATLFASLPQVVNPPNPIPANSLWSSSFVYNVPSDFLRLVQVSPYADFWLWDGIGFVQPQDYIVQNGTLITWVSPPLAIRYIADVQNSGNFPATFREALAATMAAAMCERLTQSSAKRQAAEAYLMAALSEARRTNAIQKPAGETPQDPWLTVRN